LNAHSNANGNNDSLASDDWQEIAKTREEKIVQLEHENAVLRDEQNLLVLEVSYPHVCYYLVIETMFF